MNYLGLVQRLVMNTENYVNSKSTAPARDWIQAKNHHFGGHHSPCTICLVDERNRIVDLNRANNKLR
jgi:hypothetical protein